MRVNLLKSVEMEKNAVIALTDDQSQEFANQSASASTSVEQNLKQLDSLMGTVPLADEKKLVTEFNTCWAELRKLDHAILELAVQNTNLKAASLSQGEGAETLTRYENALDAILKSYSGTPNEGRVAELLYHAGISALKIQTLHSTHISEASDEKMDLIETQIKKEETEASTSLDKLSSIIGEKNRENLLQAKTAFSEFMTVTSKVITLSRKNSNIKSLELSLGRKRKIAAQCDEILVTLQEVIQNKTVKATK
jgi:hypothetical protein